MGALTRPEVAIPVEPGQSQLGSKHLTDKKGIKIDPGIKRKSFTMSAEAHTLLHVCGGQRTTVGTTSSPPTLWALRTELSGQAAWQALSPSEPSHF